MLCVMDGGDDDWTLLTAWRTGDRAAGGKLVQRHFGAVSRFFRNKVSSADDAAELVSETFLGCTRARDGFRGDTSFRRYAFAIALNVLRNYIRQKRKRQGEAVDFGVVCARDLAPSSMSSIIMRRREAQLLVLALREIPLDYQIALELNIFEELSGREIAELHATITDLEGWARQIRQVLDRDEGNEGSDGNDGNDGSDGGEADT